ncbi:hypothetical protein LTR10_019447 [Elasticomyces elasticus]|uniref:Uncharacterized protein n=1 Tax=Exophiala sideris TaxID=1016849 RepID=A0ABR0J238_9EURO|nr:hypothetical protein LTR10_019447 [Elasticomyces elasticus]KAK5024075.1 hypothetical protein LTS07_008809 [Exophiala sideris]KAK5029063.1 hypothetical protein LTR13_008934 [Exophiala sideris]KAK5054787.1 hypothetical protein LTR69_008694 [Exophiala sideris]KAK5178886.1 hypothetical protein LTR44_008715 [Eurotiomycetes sp. CCFEE 6388]
MWRGAQKFAKEYQALSGVRTALFTGTSAVAVMWYKGTSIEGTVQKHEALLEDHGIKLSNVERSIGGIEKSIGVIEKMTESRQHNPVLDKYYGKSPHDKSMDDAKAAKVVVSAPFPIDGVEVVQDDGGQGQNDEKKA